MEDGRGGEARAGHDPAAAQRAQGRRRSEAQDASGVLRCILIDLTKGSFTEPYTWALLIFSFIGSLAIPCYYIAGKRYSKDKANLESAV